MKIYTNNFLWFFTSAILLLGCIEEVDKSRFYTENELTITAYLEENSDQYSKLLQILEATGFKTTLNAYGNYTFFIFDDQAVDDYLSDLGRASLADFSVEELELLLRYHTLPSRRFSSEFGNTSLPDSTISGDFLVTTFDESGIQGIKINRTATILTRDIELSNGIVHTIDKVLPPIVKTVPQLIEENPGYSIFTEALKNTGWYEELNKLTFEIGESIFRNNITVMVEPDSAYHNLGIHTYADLVAQYSHLGDPANQADSLNLFVANHIIRNTLFLGDLETANYETLAGSLISVDVDGEFFEINKLGDDSLKIFTTFIEPMSDQQAKNGVFHTVRGIRFLEGDLYPRSSLVELFVPPAAYVLWEFTEQPEWAEIKGTRGPWLTDISDFTRMSGEISGKGLSYYGRAEQQYLEADMLNMEGTFDITFTLPKIVQGKYLVKLYTKGGGSGRSTIQFFMNGRRLGDPIDLSTFGFRFLTIELGNVNFRETTENELRVISVSPGQAFLDYVELEPTE